MIGDVSLGSGSAVWYGSVVRGDSGHIQIGSNSSVGDRATLNGTVHIGNHVSIGSGSSLAGCQVGDEVVIGAGSVLSENVRINGTN